MNQPNSQFRIGNRLIGKDQPTYFIADIAANHDGDLQRAKDLIHLAKKAGADAAKFQHFKAETIVSDYGFRNLASTSHQASWKKSVFEVYKDASVSSDWTPILKQTCDQAGIDFFTTPYGYDLVEEVDPYVPAYKIGSGDITWTEYIRHVASKGKPTILATGAATTDDVVRAVDAGLSATADLALLQCNTNYTGNIENFKYVQLNVLKTFSEMFPGMILGLSDHTPGHAAVLGAIALGGRIIEKHFTDDVTRTGPDHKFSLDGRTWREMVDRSRELEYALGNGLKKIEDNEKDTIIVQRRGICADRDLAAGSVVTAADVTMLRPCPARGLPPYRLAEVVGRSLKRAVKSKEPILWSDLS